MLFSKLKKAIRIKDFSSSDYWDNRYRKGGNSGVGSYGRLAEFKASVINHLVDEKNIETVIEFGFGDGNQLTLSNYVDYIGFDVSPTAVSICRNRFSEECNKQFFAIENYEKQMADLVLSLDVIFHLVEDDIYNTYMRRLVAATGRFLVIYSSDSAEEIDAAHVRHRKFSEWIDKFAPNLSLLQRIENPFPYDLKDMQNTSFCDFWIYQRIMNSESHE